MTEISEYSLATGCYPEYVPSAAFGLVDGCLSFLNLFLWSDEMRRQYVPKIFLPVEHLEMLIRRSLTKAFNFLTQICNDTLNKSIYCSSQPCLTG